MLDYG